MTSIIEQLGFRKKIHVGIAVSVNNFVELVCVDDATRSVVRYASGNVKYNTAIREIMDFDEFTEVLDGLFAEAGLHPSECVVTLTLPNVHFGITDVEANYETPYLMENIQTEIEDLYIFKRSDPAIAFSVLNSSKSRSQVDVAYSAIQSVVLGRIMQVLESMNAEVVRIDSSYSALLKTLQYCDRFSKYFEREEKTAIILVTPSSCAAFSMLGNELTDFTEEALAVKSLSTEEVYSTISKIASDVISKNMPSSLLVISETDEVNAEQLLAGLDFQGNTDYFNKGIGSSDSFISVTGSQHDVDPNMVSYLTLEAVGSAVADYDDFPLDLNYIPEEKRNNNIIKVGEYEIDMAKFIVIALILGVLGGAVLGYTVQLLLKTQINRFKNDADQTQADIGVFKRKIEDNTVTEKKTVFPILKKITDNNKLILDTYNILSADLIDGVYVKRFVVAADGELGIYGVAKSAELASDYSIKVREHNPELLFSGVSLDSTQDLFASTLGNNDGINFALKTANFSLEGLEGIADSINSVNKMQQVNPPVQQDFNNFMAPPPPVI